MPQPSVRWLKDGKEVAIDGNLIRAESSDDGTQRLFIKSAASDSVGEYRCEVYYKFYRIKLHLHQNIVHMVFVGH